MNFERSTAHSSPHQVEDLSAISTQLLQEVYVTYSEHSNDEVFTERVRKELIRRDNQAMLEVSMHTSSDDSDISPDEHFHSQ